ncbi:hypothetical protein OS493_017017 [Desmophyllum pertusum]|uniref:Apple domain-containing protein n=1 Tax=Desmophyllum pertusum TaxID=174260 RepID=A0A9X0CMK5_9CNID|nr:hypothetical protein OS493_017017 [Desmophyllum pertusum]
MNIFDAFPVLAVVAVLTATNVIADCDVKSGTGLALTGHAYSSFPVRDFEQCYERCKADEPKCHSLNYHGDHMRCDLNNSTRTLHPEFVVEKPLSVYFESRYRVSVGSQRFVAGRTCEDILSREHSAVDGFYWLNSNGNEDPYVTFCNMTNGGGGGHLPS